MKKLDLSKEDVAEALGIGVERQYELFHKLGFEKRKELFAKKRSQMLEDIRKATADEDERDWLIFLYGVTLGFNIEKNENRNTKE